MVAFGIAQKGNFFERKNCPIARRIKGLDWGHMFFHCTCDIHVIQTCHTLWDPEQCLL